MECVNFGSKNSVNNTLTFSYKPFLLILKKLEMAKINFTPEHSTRLKELAVKALFDGETFKPTGIGVNEQTIYDLIHNVSLDTLTKYHASLKKQASEIENMDEWNLTDYQQRKAASLKKTQELVNLIIGYRRSEIEKAAEKKALQEKLNLYKQLKEEAKTPEERMKELEAEIIAAGGTL